MNSSTNAVVVTQVEAIRAAVMSVVTSGASLLVVTHILFISVEGLAVITTFASNMLILLFLFWKPKSSIVSPQTIAVAPSQVHFITPQEPKP